MRTIALLPVVVCLCLLSNVQATDKPDFAAFLPAGAAAKARPKIDFECLECQTEASASAPRPRIDFSCLETLRKDCRCQDGENCTCGDDCECKTAHEPPEEKPEATAAKPSAGPTYPVRPAEEWGVMIEQPSGRHVAWTKANLIDHMVENKTHGFHWDRDKLELATFPEVASIHRDEHDGRLSSAAAWYMKPGQAADSSPRVFAPTPQVAAGTTCYGGNCYRVNLRRRSR